MTRKRLTTKEREAACLLMIKRGDGSWLIPEPLRSCGDAKAICRSVEYDHATPVAMGGTNRAGNTRPMAPADHLVKTRKDVAVIAKSKRITKAQESFRQRLLAKSGSAPAVDTPERAGCIRSGRRIRSASFKGWRKFDGTPVYKG